jgi:hypothetical protein
MKTASMVSCGILASVLIPALRAAEQNPNPQTRQSVQHFDVNPHWDSQNNDVKVKPIPVTQDFGFSNTNHAAGAAAGEIGGRIQRSTKPAYYGMQLVQPATLDQKLHCSGQFVIAKTKASSGLYFGWFNTGTMEARPRNWMGLLLNGESNGVEVHAGFKTAGGHSEGIRATGTGPTVDGVRQKKLIPSGIVYTFDYVYDPEGNGGAGEVIFTLGGTGPLTGGPFTFKVSPDQRKAGATFNAFGIVNSQSSGDQFEVYFDDLAVNGQKLTFDSDPKWIAKNNRDQHEDYGLDGAHHFGFSDTALAGGKRGELGGLIFSSAAYPGYCAANIGRLSLDNRLIASGKLALKEYGSDGGMYVGWFDSKKRGYPPVNIVGALIDGTTSSGPRFRACVASSDAKLEHCQWETSAPIAPDGAAHSWKIEYAPEDGDGRGRLTVWLDQRQDSFVLPDGIKKKGATFDRFGLFVHEAGGRGSLIYLDDLEYTDGGDTR